MALSVCPLCSHADSRLIHSLPHAPKCHLVDREYPISPLDFGPMQVVECSSCGHIYNAAFDPDDAESMYVHSHMTNAPVSPGMIAAVRETAEQILSACPGARRALEIGGGSGALALAIAARGIEVVMVEPNRHSDVSALAGQGVTLIPEVFPSDKVTGKFDLIVCRQVLEHVPDPVKFMDAVDSFLAVGGGVYLEVPNADYILQNRALVDFHFPHIQYFRQRVLTKWLERRGYDVSAVISIKDNHDAGYFLARRAGEQVSRDTANGNPPGHDLEARSVASDFAVLRMQAAERLRQAPKPIALYGATAYSQAFFGAWPNCGVDRVFDDTQGYWGSCVYGPKGPVPVVRCDKDSLAEVGTVIICAYLHDREILKKLKAQGYEGRVFTLRAKAANLLDSELTSLV